MLDFPTPTSIGQVYAGTNGVNYIWTGTLWLASGASAGGDFCAAQTSAFPALTNSFATMILTQVITGNSPAAYYSTSTGRYTPPAGRYALDATYTAHCTASAAVFYLKVRKNGVDVTTSMDVAAAAGQQANPVVSVILDANGTDYFDIQAASGSATSNVFSSITFTAFPISGIKGPPGDPTPGTLIQTVSYQTGAVATGTTITPIDDTIPQITEGTEFMTLAITPKSATSKLIITTNGFFCHTIATAVVVAALHRDSVANALAASWINIPSVNAGAQLTFTHTMTSGTTSPITFRYRAGGNAAGTTTFNGQSSTRTLGGVMASSIVIEEVAP